MSSGVQEYTLEQAKNYIEPILDDPDYAERFIRKTDDPEVLKYLIEKHSIDQVHNRERGSGDIRQAILSSKQASFRLKKRVATRGDRTTDLDILVPDQVYRTAMGAIEAGKPIVLYAPTGTGKTTFAKQLALESSVGYTLDTASPSWTSQDIVGRIAPDYSESEISYTKELVAYPKVLLGPVTIKKTMR